MITRFCFYAVLGAAFLSMVGCAASQKESAASQKNGDLQMEDPFNPDRPPTPRTLYVMADMLSAQGRDDESEALFQRIVADSPNFFPAYNRLAEIQMRNRRIPEAIQTLSAGLQINPDDGVLLNNLGMCWLVRKEYDLALEYFTQAAGIMPENTRYRSNMATTLVLLGRQNEALALYKQILPKEEALENIQILLNSIETPSVQ